MLDRLYRPTYQNGSDSNDAIHRSIRLSRVLYLNSSSLSSVDTRTEFLLLAEFARNKTVDV